MKAVFITLRREIVVKASSESIAIFFESFISRGTRLFGFNSLRVDGSAFLATFSSLFCYYNARVAAAQALSTSASNVCDTALKVFSVP